MKKIILLMMGLICCGVLSGQNYRLKYIETDSARFTIPVAAKMKVIAGDTSYQQIYMSLADLMDSLHLYGLILEDMDGDSTNEIQYIERVGESLQLTTVDPGTAVLDRTVLNYSGELQAPRTQVLESLLEWELDGGTFSIIDGSNGYFNMTTSDLKMRKGSGAFESNIEMGSSGLSGEIKLDTENGEIKLNENGVTISNIGLDVTKDITFNALDQIIFNAMIGNHFQFNGVPTGSTLDKLATLDGGRLRQIDISSLPFTEIYWDGGWYGAGDSLDIDLAIDSTAAVYKIWIPGGNDTLIIAKGGGIEYGANISLSLGGTLSGKEFYNYNDDQGDLISSFLEGDNVDLVQNGNILEINASGDGVGIDGSGTSGKIPVFTSSTTIGDGIASDDGDNFSIAGQALINGGIRLIYEIDNDLGDNMNIQIRSTAPSGAGNYIYRQIGYDTTTQASSGGVVVWGSQTSVDKSIRFYTDGNVPLILNGETVTLPDQIQGSHGGPLDNWEFAMMGPNGELERSQIGIDEPILNGGLPNDYEIPYYDPTNPQLLQSNLGFRYQNGTNLIINDTNNSITSPVQKLYMDGAAIGYGFGNLTPDASQDYFYTGTVNLSTIPSSWSGTAIGTIYGNYTSDWKFLQGRTAVIRGATNPLSTAIAEIVGSTASEKLSRVVYPNGTTEYGYDATFRQDVDVTQDLNVTLDGYIGGNLGIGDSTPDSKLHVSGGDIRVTKNNGQTMLFEYSPSPSNYKLLFEQTITSGNVRWGFTQTNNGTTVNDVLVMDQGNVIIGGTDASAKLDVVGDTELNGDVTIDGRVYDYEDNEGEDWQIFGRIDNDGADLDKPKWVDPHLLNGIATGSTTRVITSGTNARMNVTMSIPGSIGTYGSTFTDGFDCDNAGRYNIKGFMNIDMGSGASNKIDIRVRKSSTVVWAKTIYASFDEETFDFDFTIDLTASDNDVNISIDNSAAGNSTATVTNQFLSITKVSE